MKRYLPGLTLLFFVNACIGQIEFYATEGGGRIEARDMSGTSLFKQYDGDISGSPYLNDRWAPAMITLSRGKITGPVMVKLNLESNELHYLDNAGKEIVANKEPIRKIDYVNYFSGDSIRFVFKRGYPANGKLDSNYFYQVFVEGKCELIARKNKYIRENKNELTGDISREFTDGAGIYYVYANYTIQQFRPFKSLILELMRDRKTEIEKYMDEHQTRLKNIHSLIDLFRYYNTL